jgi:hypothetical protein
MLVMFCQFLFSGSKCVCARLSVQQWIHWTSRWALYTCYCHDDSARYDDAPADYDVCNDHVHY